MPRINGWSQLGDYGKDESHYFIMFWRKKDRVLYLRLVRFANKDRYAIQLDDLTLRRFNTKGESIAFARNYMRAH